MSLKLNGVIIPYTGNVKLNGSSLRKVSFNGSPVWLKSTDGWATLWSGSQSYYDRGGFIVLGLTNAKEVRVTARVKFAERVQYSPTSYYYYDFVNVVLPQSLNYNQAYIKLNHSGEFIFMEFYTYTDSYKGVVTEYSPEEITFTEVQVKL